MNRMQLDALLQKYGGQRDEIILLGVRTNSKQVTDEFDDLVGFATKNEIMLFKGTTHPGPYWTEHRMAPPHGAAHMALGWHQDIWQVGMHFNWKALVQNSALNPATGKPWCGPIKIWRDDHNDGKQDADDPLQAGWFGIDYHHANNSPKIGQWSAGCQVIQSTSDFAMALAAVKNSAKYKADPHAKFSYLLVSRDDFA